jgi:RNA polymerase sigma-70 factor (ECF subfamily)
MLVQADRLTAAIAEPSDLAVADAIAAGDHEAFRALMQRHNRLLYRTARAIVRDDFDAEDAVQSAYLLAYRNISTFKGGSALSTWLVRIVINEALACLRRRSRLPQPLGLGGRELDDVMDATGELEIKRPEQPDEALMRGDIRRLLESKIDELPLAYRTVFMLRGLEELSVSETAVALDVPPATVRTRFFRAKSLLRKSLSGATRGELEAAFAFAGERCARIAARVLAALCVGRSSS